MLEVIAGANRQFRRRCLSLDNPEVPLAETGCLVVIGAIVVALGIAIAPVILVGGVATTRPTA